MKDHEIREAINELRDIAIKYRDAECLREAIAPIVHSIVRKSKLHELDLIKKSFEDEAKENIKYVSEITNKDSKNKVTLTNPSDYSMPFYRE
jgi:hypothetical protein